LRIPRALAWLLVGMGVFTAGLLRQYHDLTPGASFLGPAVGSLLFGCILFLFLVAARERQIGAAPGPGIRVGSLTPLLLMLLGEKWISSSAYPALFARIAPADLPPESADAWFRLLCGVGLLAVVLVTSRFSAPAAAWVGRRLAPSRVLPPLGMASAAIATTYAFLAALSLLAGARVGLMPTGAPGPVLVIVLGQAALALGEEAYFRGLVLGEILRLLPRLGVASGAWRRWIAVGATSAMFAMEHLGGASTWEELVRRSVFTLALGLLFGLLVLATANLWFAAFLHAWIDWLLLGVAPRLATGSPEAGWPPGVYIFVALILAFVAAYRVARSGLRARTPLIPEPPRRRP